VGNRLFFFAHLESRQAAIATGIQTRLELREGGQTRVLEIPYGTLLRLATESHPFLADLLENWHHNAVNQLRLFAANEEVEKERRDSSSRSRSPQRSGSLVRGNVLDIDLMDVAAAAATATATATASASASAAAIPAASMRDKTGGGGTNGSCSLSAQVKTLQLSSRSQQQQHQPPRHHTSPGKKLRDDPRKRKRSDSHHRGGNGSHHSHSK
jgi:septal ring-binding cell division protein DamX